MSSSGESCEVLKDAPDFPLLVVEVLKMPGLQDVLLVMQMKRKETEDHLFCQG